jgi:hypothetical protein
MYLSLFRVSTTTRTESLDVYRVALFEPVLLQSEYSSWVLVGLNELIIFPFAGSILISMSITSALSNCAL